MGEKKTKAMVLLSGGLDSMLAVKVLLSQGIEVTGIVFESPFYSAERAGKAALALGIKLITRNIGDEMLDIVKNPPSGYGKRMNPCVDCHALMIRLAGEEAKKAGADIVATGEVLGQRPFSQTMESLRKVGELAGIEILRPLSAKLLPETEAEKKGLADRRRLLDISGRTRSRQEELAGLYGLNDYPSPAGGCLLTDPGYSERLIKILDHWPEMSVNDAELLKHGRIFWFNSRKNKVMAVIGRHREDNDNLQRLAKAGDILIELISVNGPTTIVRGSEEAASENMMEIRIPENVKLSGLDMGSEKSSEEIIKIAALLTGYYAVKARGKSCLIKIYKV